MRFYELQGGIQYWLSQEEDKLFNKIHRNNNKYPLDKLNDREQEVSRKLVSRGVFNKYKYENIYYIEINNIDEITNC
jgi:hypothetical protein